MELELAEFTFQHRAGCKAYVTFFSGAGKPHLVVVVSERLGSQPYRVDNTDGTWRPCVADSLELIKLASGVGPGSLFARRRATRPHSTTRGTETEK